MGEKRFLVQKSTESELEELCNRVIHLSGTSLGPCGKLRWVGSFGDCSNCSERIPWYSSSQRQGNEQEEGQPQRKALEKLFEELVSPQTRQHGDGGLQVRLLTALLTLNCIKQPIHPLLFCAGLEMALDWCEAGLQAMPQERLRLSDASQLNRVVGTFLNTKHAIGLDTEQLHHLSSTFVEGFATSLNISRDGQVKHNLKFVLETGKPVAESQALKQQVVLDLPLPPQSLSFVLSQLGDNSSHEVRRVALFQCSVLLDGRSVPIVPESRFQEDDWVVRDAQVKMLQGCLQALVRSKVKLVLSQKLIHPWLRQKLFKDHGIICIERVAISNLAGVQDITGATPLSSWSSEYDECKLGTFDTLSVVRLGARDQLVIHADTSNRRKICTLLLRAQDQLLSNELAVLAKRSVRFLDSFIQDPRFCPGAGASELYLASFVRTRLKSFLTSPEAQEMDVVQRHHIKNSVDVFASSLESLVTALQPSNGMPGALCSRDILERLSIKETDPLGWDPLSETPCRIASFIRDDVDDDKCRCHVVDVVDAVTVKRSVLQNAVRAASVLVKIKSVVFSSSHAN